MLSSGRQHGTTTKDRAARCDARWALGTARHVFGAACGLLEKIALINFELNGYGYRYIRNMCFVIGWSHRFAEYIAHHVAPSISSTVLLHHFVPPFFLHWFAPPLSFTVYSHHCGLQFCFTMILEPEPAQFEREPTPEPETGPGPEPDSGRFSSVHLNSVGFS